MDRFICMSCGKLYQNGDMPTKGNLDGCCSPGSLLECNGSGRVGKWLVLGDSVFDYSKGRSGELIPNIDNEDVKE